MPTPQSKFRATIVVDSGRSYTSQPNESTQNAVQAALNNCPYGRITGIEIEEVKEKEKEPEEPKPRLEMAKRNIYTLRAVVQELRRQVKEETDYIYRLADDIADNIEGR